MEPRYPLAVIDDVPDDIRDTILAVQEKSGFVPTVFLMLARRPAEFRAFFAYHDAIMLRAESHLSKGDRELVVTSISGANRCTYCVVAHGALLRIYEKQPLLADQVAVNHRTADIDARQRAILDFAHAVNARSHEVEQSDIDALAVHGLDAEDAWDIMSITAFFGLSNRVASVTGMMPNPEFYLMGRVPRPA
ncbi:peroxidase-related enzyme [Dermatophilaceae bacterium Soc4.6]